MILPENLIEHVAPKKDIRRYLTHVYLDAPAPVPDDAEQGAPGMLVATNGHILAAVPVTLEPGDAPGYVTTEAIKAARTAARKNRKPEPVIHANGALAIADGPTYPRPAVDDVGRFPDWRAVYPRALQDDGPPDIMIDADLLATLAAALDSGKGRRVALRFSRRTDDEGRETIDPSAVIRVTGTDPDAIGLIMPCRL